ncbi:MAG: TIGR03084 family metal-binding protein [Chloroflexota bacterium]
MTYAALLDDLAAEHEWLDSIVAPLSETEWSVLTPAEGWTIRDAVAHLAVTDDAAGLAAADPAAFEIYRAARHAGVDPFETARGMAAPDLLSLWRANRRRLLHSLNGLEPKTRITWFGPPMAAMSHATARLMETWAHGQDIADTLLVDRAPTARLKHIAHLGVRTRGYSYAQRGLAQPATDVRVELAAPDGGTWTWGDPAAPDRISGTAPDFCLVVVQRRHVDDTDLACHGPRAREWLLIAQAFAGQAGAGRHPGQFAPSRG